MPAKSTLQRVSPYEIMDETPINTIPFMAKLFETASRLGGVIYDLTPKGRKEKKQRGNATAVEQQALQEQAERKLAERHKREDEERKREQKLNYRATIAWKQTQGFVRQWDDIMSTRPIGASDEVIERFKKERLRLLEELLNKMENVDQSEFEQYAQYARLPDYKRKLWVDSGMTDIQGRFTQTLEEVRKKVLELKNEFAERESRETANKKRREQEKQEIIANIREKLALLPGFKKRFETLKPQSYSSGLLKQLQALRDELERERDSAIVYNASANLARYVSTEEEKKRLEKFFTVSDQFRELEAQVHILWKTHSEQARKLRLEQEQREAQERKSAFDNLFNDEFWNQFSNATIENPAKKIKDLPETQQELIKKHMRKVNQRYHSDATGGQEAPDALKDLNLAYSEGGLDAFLKAAKKLKMELKLD